MAQKFNLKNAEQVRRSTTIRQQKRVKKMYETLYQDIVKKVSSMENGNLQKQNLLLLQRDIKNRVQTLSSNISDGIISDVKIVSNEVVEDSRAFLLKCGFRESEIHDAFSYIPNEVVKNIANGNIYQNDWSLSGAIWGYNKRLQQDINNIISIGVAQGNPTIDIAREIERYINPSTGKSAKTIQSWRYATQIDVSAGRAKAVGEKITDKVYFGKVDYNALRLSRTMISHAYQQSFEIINKNDPFVVGYRWLTSNFHGRVCEICRGRSETDQFGLGVGVFPKDKLPLDHPNGMCVYEAVIEDSMDDIAKKIGEWYQSPTGTFPNIDKYSMDF